MLKICITAEEGVERGTPHFVVRKKYAEYLEARGFLVFTPADARAAAEYAELADGLLLPDGPDIHVARYGGYYTDYAPLLALTPSRDDFEFALFAEFRKRGKPVCGVGRGAHVVNASLGGARGEIEIDLPPLFAASPRPEDGAERALLARFADFCERGRAE